MKSAVLIVSIGALLCAGIAWLTTGDLSAICVLLAVVLAITAGIMSAVNAGRIEHPLWSGALAAMTLLGVVSVCDALNIKASYFDLYGPYGPSPDTQREIQLLWAAPVVVLPLTALLSALLLRPGKPKPAEPPAEPPAST